MNLFVIYLILKNIWSCPIAKVLRVHYQHSPIPNLNSIEIYIYTGFVCIRKVLSLFIFFSLCQHLVAQGIISNDFLIWKCQNNNLTPKRHVW